jgi:hypothetical protein
MRLKNGGNADRWKKSKRKLTYFTPALAFSPAQTVQRRNVSRSSVFRWLDGTLGF